MQTFGHHFKRILTSSLFIAIFASYSPVFAETTETKDKDEHHAHNSFEWPGIYYGSLPCADCVGIKTQLALNKNNSYVMITQYLGKSEREFVEKGKYTWSNQSKTIVLTPKNSSTTQQYAVAENTLIQLDANGNRISGKQADRYILRRTDVTDSTKPHSGH
ncbi:MAG: copper resistance protein NlpE [Methylococcaceae bacterium]|nr:copper resistance protein NlpE [Methylococcaceae bacterium]